LLPVAEQPSHELCGVRHTLVRRVFNCRHDYDIRDIDDTEPASMSNITIALDRRLLQAAKSGDLRSLEQTLGEGGNVNVRSTDFKQTALHIAKALQC